MTNDPRALKNTICMVGYVVKYLTVAFINAKESVLNNMYWTALKKEDFKKYELFLQK